MCFRDYFLVFGLFAAQTYFCQGQSSWQVFNAPGGTGTLFESIHDGVIAGTRSANGVVSGLLYQTANQTWATPYYAPNSSSTWFYGNGQTTVVGEFRDGTTYQGLILENGSSESIFHPAGSTFTSVRGVSGRFVSGYFSTGTGGYLGFVKNLDQSGYQTIQNPLAANTYAEDIHGGRVVGWYQEAASLKNLGFIYESGQWKTLAMEGAVETKAYGVYGDLVVGHFKDSANLIHGFLYNDTDASWTILDAPGATATYAKDVGLDAAGVLAVTGYFYDGSFISNYGYQEKGFLTVPEPSVLGLIGFSGCLFLFRKRVARKLKA